MASTASPNDVQDVIETDLSLSQIQAVLDDAVFDIDQAVSETLTTEHRTQLEKYLAALKIRQSKDRSFDEGEDESTRISYAGDEIQWLRGEVDKRDPSGTLASHIIRDTDRHVAATGDE